MAAPLKHPICTTLVFLATRSLCVTVLLLVILAGSPASYAGIVIMDFLTDGTEVGAG